jgi:predicted alpha/beta superfamily hydrolase
MQRYSVLLLLFLTFDLVFSQPGKNYVVGQSHEIYSEILNENRTVIIGLPQNYNPMDKTYSVVVLLDGDYHFISTYGNLEYLSKRFLIPEMILVAVPSTNRVRDLTPTKTKINFDGDVDVSLDESGGASNFLTFLEDELLRWVKQNFSVNDLDVIIGHSWGGLVVTKAFLNEKTAFDKFLAIDPSYWWDNQFFIREVEKKSISHIPSQKRMFISASSFKVEQTSGKCCKHRNSIDLFYAALKETSNANEQIALQYFEEEDHASVPVPSTYYGLKYLFKDYSFENANYKSFEEIEAHFVEYFSTFQKQVKIPEDLIRNVGQYQLYAKNEVDQAMRFFKYNNENYPNSIKAHQSISRAYSKIGESALAKKHKEIADKLKNSN